MIKVFVIDDSTMVRHGFRKLFEGAVDIVLIGEAPNPIDAFEVFKQTGLPDVFILDIEMPKMDGLTFLKKINAQRPIPVIICSTLAHEGSLVAIDAMRLGAVDIVEKPKLNLSDFFHEYQADFLERVRIAAKSNARLSARSDILPTREKKEVKPIPSKNLWLLAHPQEACKHSKRSSLIYSPVMLAL